MPDIAASIFRAYDVRGVVGQTFGADEAFVIGRALASLYPQCPRVFVGRDGRMSSPDIADALMRGLCESGADAVDVGMLPTPALYHAAHAHNGGTGLMVTGSHNPPEYNGVKMMMDGETLAGEEIQAVYKKCLAGDFAEGDGRRGKRAALDEYVDAIVNGVEVGRKLRVVVDCGNGVAGPAALKVLGALAGEVHPLYCDVDGNFPNHHPNPSDPENLKELAAAVVAGKYDLGFAFDGDGDRIGVVNGDGGVVWPDRQMMIYAREVLSRNSGATVIYDVKSSRHLAEEIKRLGGEAVMCRTGHSFVKSKVKETGAALAGEMSGHIFFNDRWPGFDDALYAAARMLEAVTREPGTPTQTLSRLPDAVSTPELNIEFEREGAQHEFMERFARAADFGDAEIVTVDGLRVEFRRGWGLVRASNTTACLVLRFEANNTRDLALIQERFCKQLLKVEPGLSLPKEMMTISPKSRAELLTSRRLKLRNPEQASPTLSELESYVFGQAEVYAAQFQDAVVVIKFGGKAMSDAELSADFERDVALLKEIGMHPVVVHGGGPMITKSLADAGVESRFVDGVRVTDDATMAVVEKVLRKVNAEICAKLEGMKPFHVRANGLADGGVLKVKRMPSGASGGDLGRVGLVDEVATELKKMAVEEGVIPIVAPLGVDVGGVVCNINADYAAEGVATALRAKKLLLVTDTDGVLDADGKLIAQINATHAKELINRGVISGGMAPKVRCALNALKSGVERVHIINGCVDHAVMQELLTDEGVGTMFTAG